MAHLAPMIERVLAVVLVTAGVWLQWGAGFALIVAGAGVMISGVALEDVVKGVAVRVRPRLIRLRATMAAMPRRSVAAALVGVSAVVLPAAAFLAVGIWAALAAFGALTLAGGSALGWE